MVTLLAAEQPICATLWKSSSTAAVYGTVWYTTTILFPTLAGTEFLNTQNISWPHESIKIMAQEGRVAKANLEAMQVSPLRQTMETPSVWVFHTGFTLCIRVRRDVGCGHLLVVFSIAAFPFLSYCLNEKCLTSLGWLHLALH